MKPTVVGIAGGTGSGKSTFCTLLVNELQNYKVEVISTDKHYKKVLPKMKSPISHKELDDFNHPDAMNYEKFMDDLRGLLNAEDQADVIIIEGIFTLYFEEIRELLDLKIFVDLDADERMYRRIKRNMENWGISMEEIADYYLQAAKHQEAQFALQTKKFAEIIINGNHLDGNAKNVVCAWINSRVQNVSVNVD
jgi:uridine kinase